MQVRNYLCIDPAFSVMGGSGPPRDEGLFMILAVNQDIKIAGGPWWDSRVVRALLHTRQGDTPRFTDHTAAGPVRVDANRAGGGSRAAFHPDDLRGLSPCCGHTSTPTASATSTSTTGLPLAA